MSPGPVATSLVSQPFLHAGVQDAEEKQWQSTATQARTLCNADQNTSGTEILDGNKTKLTCVF